MTTQEKRIITDLLIAKLADMGLSQNRASAMIGVSGATISNMIGGKWDRISDELWHQVGNWCQFGQGWVTAITPIFELIQAECQAAQYSSRSVAISYEPGSGKTHALRHYAKTSTNVFYLECEGYFTKKIFVQKILQAMGLTAPSSLAESIEAVIIHLNRLRSPLLIIDEADKLIKGKNIEKLEIFKTLFNKCENAGFILCGAPYLEQVLTSGVRLNKQSFVEIYSRVDRGFVQIKRNNDHREVKKLCVANGITDEQDIKEVIAQCGSLAFDLRHVRKLIENKLMLLVQKGGNDEN